MKKKRFRLAALLMALILVFGALSTAGATDVDDYTLPDLEAWAQARAEALYNALMATTVYEELYPLLEDVSGEMFDQFLAALPETEAQALIAHLDAIYPKLDPWTPTVNFTRAAPLVEQPKAQARGQMAAFGATPFAGADDAVHLSKTVVPKPGSTDVFAVTLEAYTTGTVITTESQKPLDIVLVLDESYSMAEDFQEYRMSAVTGGSVTGASRYGFSDTTNLFVEVGGMYYPLTYENMDRTNSPRFQYYSYNDSTGTTKYVYPILASGSPTNRVYNYDVVQFYRYGLVNSGTTRMQALKNAAKDFVDSVAAKTAGGTVDHRISVVGFSATNATTKVYVGLTSVGTESGKNTVKATLADNPTNNANVISNTGRGATYTDVGISRANGVFSGITSERLAEADRVMIVFTDGFPSSNGTAFSNSIANDAIGAANTAKNTHKATVYTIGIFAGADGSSPGSLPSDTGTDTQKANRFMHLLSSNYLTATSMTNTGAVNPNLNGKSYYLSAGSAGSLSSVFQTITNQISTPDIPLDAETILRDIVAPSFELADTAKTIYLYTQDSIDMDAGTWGARVPIPSSSGVHSETVTDADGNDVVNVLGFDFGHNFVSNVGRTQEGEAANFRGRKLVIEFDIKVRSAFLGGNNVSTNGPASGIYLPGESEPLDTFDVPLVNIQIPELEVVMGPDKHVYLHSDMSGEHLIAGATATAETDVAGGTGILYRLDQENYGLEDYQNGYVNISYSFKDEDGNTFTELTDLVEDGVYTLTVYLNPKYPDADPNALGSEVEGTVNTDDINILVYSPTLTFEDSYIWYGDGNDAGATSANQPAYYAANNRVGAVAWTHRGDWPDEEAYEGYEGNTLPPGASMTGTEPTVGLTYTPDAGQLFTLNVDGTPTTIINSKKDIPVNVAATLTYAGKTAVDVTADTVFVHENCALDPDDPCGWTTPAAAGSPAFLLHPLMGTLTINKTGGAEDESYVFNINRNGSHYMTVSTMGNDTVVIRELPVGIYSIAEEAAWSWRWEAQSGGPYLLLPTMSCTFNCANDSNDKDKWLNGYSPTAVNAYTQGGGEQP